MYCAGSSQRHSLVQDEVSNFSSGELGGELFGSIFVELSSGVVGQVEFHFIRTENDSLEVMIEEACFVK